METKEDLLEVLIKKVISLYNCDRQGAYMYLIGSANKEGRLDASNSINLARIADSNKN